MTGCSDDVRLFEEYICHEKNITQILEYPSCVGKFEDHQENSVPKYPNRLGIFGDFVYHEENNT